MAAASRYQRFLATVGIFLLTAGDFLRYSITWYGWGAIVAVFLTMTVVELIRRRVDPRVLPLPLLLFLLFAALSMIWSAYPTSTAMGVGLSVITVAFGLLVGTLLTWPEVLGAISLASRFVIGLSLLFETLVSVAIRKPVLPLWIAYCDPGAIKPACYWSRDLLLEGGRIQGIVGNANILAMAALVGLVAFAVRFAARDGSRVWNGVWAALALATIALTRSSTVLVATAGVVLAAAFLVFARRFRERGAVPVHLTGLGVLALGAVVVVVARAPLLDLIGKSPDLTNRGKIWSTVIDLWLQRPVAGWGWVSYWPNWEPFFADLIVIKGISYYQAHDAWLDLLMQVGVIGAVLFALFVLLALGRSWRRALHAEPGGEGLDWPVVAAAPLLVVAVLIQSLAESRLLIEVGFLLPVLVAVAMRRRDMAVRG